MVNSNTSIDAFAVRTGTGWTIDVSAMNLSPDTAVKDFVAYDDGVLMNNADFIKNSSSQLTYTGAAVGYFSTILIQRVTQLQRVSEPTYRSSISVADYNAEINRIHKILYEVRRYASLTTSFVLTGVTTFVNSVRGVGTDIRFNKVTYGKTDNAVTAAFWANNLTAPAGVMGLFNPSDVSTYSARESVTLISSIDSPPVLFDIPDLVTTYTSTTISFAAAIDITQLKVGMFIDTKHGTKYTGELTGWASDGKSLTCAGGWYQQGNPGAGQVPPNGTGAYVSPVTKSIALNTTAALASNSFANQSSCAEFDVYNNKSDPLGDEGLPNHMCLEIASLGTYPGTIGVTQTGGFYTGFRSLGAKTHAFYSHEGTPNPTFSFRASNSTGIPYTFDKAGVVYWQVNNDGTMDLGGTTGGAGLPWIDFRTGFAHDFGARIYANGGSVTDGSADLTVNAAALRLINKPNQLTASDSAVVTADWVRQSVRPVLIAAVGGAQSIANNTVTTVTWTSSSDLDSTFSGNTTFTVPSGAGGLYQVNVTNLGLSAQGTRYDLYYSKNGGANTLFAPALIAATDLYISMSGNLVIDLAAADTLVFKVLQINSGAAARTMSFGNLVILKLGEKS